MESILFILFAVLLAAVVAIVGFAIGREIANPNEPLTFTPRQEASLEMQTYWREDGQLYDRDNP